MKSKVFILVILTFLFLKDDLRGQTSSYDKIPMVSIGVGYFGELITHPGFVIYNEIGLNKSKNQTLARLNFMYYRHKGHTRNLMLLPEFIFRRNTKNLNYWEANLGIGGLYQNADSPVYEYHEGKFHEKKSGWFYFTPSLGLRYGHTFELKNGNFLTPNFGGRIFYQYPFNDFWLLRMTIDLSISYQIK